MKKNKSNMRRKQKFYSPKWMMKGLQKPKENGGKTPH